MKKMYSFLIFTLLTAAGFSQACVSLGCAKAFAGITTTNTLALTQADNFAPCYDGDKYEQIFWEFFYSPTGGNFTQSFTPTSGTDLALNYVIFDEGTVAPTTVACPINTTGFTQIACQPNDFFNMPVGPGLQGITATTTSGHYYAVAIINWQDFPANAASNSYTFDISAPLLDSVAFTPANCPAVLPVSLASFKGNINNCKVNLNWTSTSEINLKSYEVQSSADGVQFSTVSTIPASLSSSDHTYSYNHSNTSVGKIYYRLKIIDADNNFKFSKTIPLSLSCNGNYISVYPNPASNLLNVDVADLQSSTTLAKLFDSHGKLVYSSKLSNGNNAINISRLSKGVYILNLKGSGGTQNIKVIK